MSKKKENREEEKEQSSSRSGLTDEQVEAALNACTFGKTKEVRCKDCPRDSEKEPCITNLHLAALEYIWRLKHRAARAERAFSKLVHEMYEHGIRPMCDEKFFVESRLKDAEKELAEEREDDK